MKRMNFTFLLLFSLLSFVSTQLVAQDPSCAQNRNLAVLADDGGFRLTVADFVYVGLPLPDSVYLRGKGHYVGTGSGSPFFGRVFRFTREFFLNDFFPDCKGGTMQYELYRDGAMLCWGMITLENKIGLDPMGMKDTICCITDNPEDYRWPGVSYGDCGPSIVPGSMHNTFWVDDYLCDTSVWYRTLSANIWVHDRIQKVDLRRDTLCVVPLDLDSVCAPHLEVIIECKDIDIPHDVDMDPKNPANHYNISTYLSPSKLAEGYSGPELADTLFYPYVKKPGIEEVDAVCYCTKITKTFVGQKPFQIGGVWVYLDTYDFVCIETGTKRAPGLCDAGSLDLLNKNHAPEIVEGAVHYEYFNGIARQMCSPFNKRIEFPGHTDCFGCNDTPDVTTNSLNGGGGKPYILQDNGILIGQDALQGVHCLYKDVEGEITTYNKLEVGKTCNINVKYTDWILEGKCTGYPVIMRNWEFIDWCDKEATFPETVQWIRIEDNEGPQYIRGLAPYYEVEIAPWICSATFELPRPSYWEDCGDVYLSYKASAGIISYDGDGKPKYLTNIWVDECPVVIEVIAEDGCGNQTIRHTYVLPVDNIPPVAIATDQLNVSLTHDPSNDVSIDYGIAKVYAGDIDAGSHDAGCGDVWTCVLLKEELEKPVVLGNGVGWSFRSDGVGVTTHSGGQVYIGNDPIYYAAQCVYDGIIYEYEYYKGGWTLVKEIPYVICKEYVKFCCEDIFVESEQNYQQVALVVTDLAARCTYIPGPIIGYEGPDGDIYHDIYDNTLPDGVNPHPIGHEPAQTPIYGPGTYELVYAHPNSAYSWTNIRVEDKSAAGWVCADDAVSCVYNDDYEFPKPFYGGIICNQFHIEELARVEYVECGYGYVEVTWGAYTDESLEVLVSSTTCVYDVRPAAPFNPFEIKWPKHYDGTVYDGILRECEPVLYTGGNPNNPDHYFPGIVEYYDDIPMGDAMDCDSGGDTGEPVWCTVACGLIGKSYEVDTVTSSDACYKLIKRWTIIDWCTWQPNDNYNNTFTYYEDGEKYIYYYEYEDAIPDDANDTHYDQFQAIDDEWLRVNEGIEHAITDVRITNYRVHFPSGDPHIGGGSVWVPAAPCAECPKPSGYADDIYFRYRRVDWDGYYTYDQVIKVVDDVDPEITAPDSVVVEITDGNNAKVGDYDPEEYDPYEGCFNSDVVQATVSDMCGELDLSSVGAIWWIRTTVYNADGGVEDVITNSSERGETANMSTGEGRPKWYAEIEWRVTDGCGNDSYGYTHVDFRDVKNPTPVCIQDISTAAMNTDGTVAIWAVDYDLGSYDNCSDVEVYFKDTAGNKVPSLDFTCANLGTNELKMWVSDDWGNEDYCFVTLRVDDNTGVCDGDSASGAAISGLIATELGDNLESAEVALSSGLSTQTSVEGEYAFRNNTANRDYQVRAELDKDYLNGVSTYDLVVLQKHILDIERLDSPYKLIAADANNDEKISALDALALRKLILGINAELPNNDSWRFVDAEQTFADASNPFPFKEQVDVALGTVDMDNQDFIAVKIGDLTDNAIANSLIAEGRSIASMNLQVTDAFVSAGELVDVAISAEKFVDIASYQFTMNLSGLEYVSVTAGAVNMDENALAIHEGALTAAWFDTKVVSSDDVLFTLTFKATEDVTLSKAITVNSSITRAAAFNSVGERIDLGLAFNNIEAASFVLEQNNPNPFKESTVIGFELPEAAEATLSVFDVTGKTVYTRTLSFNAGKNQFEITKAELSTTGVMYYQLESGEFTATKKMILID